VADSTGWRSAAETELRALGRELQVPPASDLTAAVRQRLGDRAVSRGRVPALGSIGRPGVRLGWRGVLVAVIAFLAVLIAIPQGRAVIIHVFRFVGIEFRQQPGPVRSPGNNALLPGQRRTSLVKARREVSFPILVPSALGLPDEVDVSGGGRVVSLIYVGTPYGKVRMDEFAGHVDQVVFRKFVHFAKITEVEVNGGQGLWIKGPEELIYINRYGTPVSASARLTTGNTLIWGTRRVALRLEGNFGKSAALAIADSAR
jgi:hypothetical protein